MVIPNAISSNVTITGGTGGAGGAAGSGSGNGGDGGAGAALNASLGGNIGGTLIINDGEAGSGSGTGTGSVGQGGAVNLTLNGSRAQTITGAVSVGEDGEGTITANNTATATNDIVFSETVGTTSVALGTLTQSDGNIQFA